MSLLKHGDEAFASMGFAYPHMTAEACCVLEALRLTRFAHAGQEEIDLQCRGRMQWQRCVMTLVETAGTSSQTVWKHMRRGLDFVLLRMYCLG